MYTICTLGFIFAFSFIITSESNSGYTLRSHAPEEVDIEDLYLDERSSNQISDISDNKENDVLSDYGYDVSNSKGRDVSSANRNNISNAHDVFNVDNGHHSIESNFIPMSIPCVNITKNKTACLCSEDGTLTDCSRRNLTFVPKVPPETITLNMSGNSLISLDQDSLTNISTLSKSLKSLDVSKNNISYVENGSLSDFTALQNLNVSANLISNTAIENLTTGISSQLENLMLEGLKLEEFPYKSMPHLNNTKNLSLKYNKMKEVNTSKIFPHIKGMTYLDLSFNSIRDIYLVHSENLKSLSLSSNALTGIPHFCHNGSRFPNLSWLFLDDNCIRHLNTERLDCLDNLHLLNISATRIERIQNNSFSGFKSLQRLTLERTESLQYIDKYAFNSSTIQRIYIRFNHVSFDRRWVDTRTIFQLCHGLLKLDLSGNNLAMVKHDDWNYLLQNISDLTYLDISNSGILFLPLAIRKHLRKLKTLHVANTGIHTIPRDYFSPLTLLENLYLNGNKFTTISAQDFPPSFTIHLQHISLGFNPFDCNCDLLWFIEFTKKYRHKMTYYPKDYKCAKYRRKQISQFKISKKSCLLKKKTTATIQSACILTMLLMLILSLVYRWRWRLRYWLYVLKFKRRKCSNSRAIPFTHDIYISSTDSDFNIIYHQILPELERKGLKVFFPDRDVLPGTMKIENVLEKIDNSKHVLLCLSNAYAQDNWCEFEAKMALERSIYEDSDKNVIIVVVLEEICSLNSTKMIHQLTRTGDYLIWDENQTDNLFWRRLGEMMDIS